MRKQHKKYTKPKNLFGKERIAEDKELVKNYGLKNKTEIWKADSEINRIRTEAKKLILKPEKQEAFFKKLEEKGLLKEKESTIDSVLSLTKENLLDRRLQTIVHKLKLAKTIKEARQLIVHRKIKLNDSLVTIPSYIVKLSEENKIKLAEKTKASKESKIQEIKEEINEVITEQ
jgi:small subunit ribosomal protein S4